MGFWLLGASRYILLAVWNAVQVSYKVSGPDAQTDISSHSFKMKNLFLSSFSVRPSIKWQTGTGPRSGWTDVWLHLSCYQETQDLTWNSFSKNLTLILKSLLKRTKNYSWSPTNLRLNHNEPAIWPIESLRGLILFEIFHKRFLNRGWHQGSHSWLFFYKPPWILRSM